MDDDKDLLATGPEDDKDAGGQTADTQDQDDKDLDLEDDADLEDASDDANGDGDQGDDAQSGQDDQRGRAASRISKLANERKAERERAEKAERDVAALRGQMEEIQRNLQSRRPDPNAEAELLAQMDPIQRVQYEADKKINMLQAEIRNVQLASQDRADKAEFLSNVTPDELAIRKQYLTNIDKELEGMRKNGLNAPRTEVYFYLLGKATAEARAKKATKAGAADRQAAQTRVTTTQGRTASVRSDAPRGRGNKTAEERLENILL